MVVLLLFPHIARAAGVCPGVSFLRARQVRAGGEGEV